MRRRRSRRGTDRTGAEPEHGAGRDLHEFANDATTLTTDPGDGDLRAVAQAGNSYGAEPELDAVAIAPGAAQDDPYLAMRGYVPGLRTAIWVSGTRGDHIREFVQTPRQTSSAAAIQAELAELEAEMGRVIEPDSVSDDLRTHLRERLDALRRKAGLPAV